MRRIGTPSGDAGTPTTRETRVASNIAEALLRGALHTVDETRTARGAPAAPGLYAWWAELESLSELPAAAEHPVEPFQLLYVGVAPSSPASSASLRSRVCGQHIAGNVASSTFRFGLASLLWRQERWQPLGSGSGKVRLTAADNRALSDWQRKHLRVSWARAEKPWLIEAEVIGLMRPPMNREHNQLHPFYSTIGSARARFRAAANMA
jgi:hypothetical protein